MGNYKKLKGIYCILNIVNNKRYIGYSINIKKRWHDHKYLLRRKLHKNDHLQKAWSKYGENNFEFSISEIIPIHFNKQECEEVEAKWVLYFNSHLSVHGYNCIIPGDTSTYKNGSNEIRGIPYVCINIDTQEKVNCDNAREVNGLTNISSNHIGELARYWEQLDIHTKRIKKSRKRWIVVRKDNYDSEFDYIGHKKKRTNTPIKPDWRKYYNKEKHRKDPKDIIPIKDRNIKRVAIIAQNVSTGEEKKYRMIKDCYNEFAKFKVYKCINNPFKKYKHRGYYFRRANKKQKK